MPHPNALFSLEPLNDKARRVVDDRHNQHHVSILANGTRVLDVGHARSEANNGVTLVTIGRGGDIHVDEASISRNQCTFEIVRESGIVMLYDRSHGQTTQVFADPDPGNKALTMPFERGRIPRRVVVRPGLNAVIGMGGVYRNLVPFRILWACNQEDVAKKIAARHDSAWCNPRLAPTMDAADTLLPSRMETRIHTAGRGMLRMRWVAIDEDPIGAGAFANVYKALDIDSGRLMAAKLMPRDLRKGEWWWAMLKREVENLDTIKHDHIVNYIFSQGWDEPQGRAEIFMGLKEGTLESLVLRDYPWPGQAQRIAEVVFYHMLQALDYLSAKGLIHRDLKPANILYTTNRDHEHPYSFQLADFGLSNRQSVAQSEVGSGIYKAPEIDGKNPQTPKADIWSLLVTILWTLDWERFREFTQMVGSKGERERHILALVASPDISNLRAMARIDPEKRASAAQLLRRHFNGNGLTTSPYMIPPFVEDDNWAEAGPRAGASPAQRGPAFPPSADVWGNAPAAGPYGAQPLAAWPVPHPDFCVDPVFLAHQRFARNYRQS